MHIPHSFVALITPMTPTGDIDFNALSSLIEWHITEGSEGLLIIGTTGESPTLSEAEQTKIIEHTVSVTNKRIPVMVGSGTNCTTQSIRRTQQAARLGADFALLAAPYYNKPTQEGMYQHYMAIADSTDIPQVLYNNPGRSITNISIETSARLSHHPHIIGLKDAHGNTARVKPLLEQCVNDFIIWSGCDDNILDFMQQGGFGVISVIANVAPALLAQCCTQFNAGHHHQAASTFKKLEPLNHSLFCETNPIAVKYALQTMKKIQAGIRLPLTPLSKEHHKTLHTALNTLSLATTN